MLTSDQLAEIRARADREAGYKTASHLEGVQAKVDRERLLAELDRLRGVVETFQAETWRLGAIVRRVERLRDRFRGDANWTYFAHDQIADMITAAVDGTTDLE